MSERARARQRLSHLIWHDVSSSCHKDRGAWLGELGGEEKNAGSWAHSAHHCHSRLAVQAILVTCRAPLSLKWDKRPSLFFLLTSQNAFSPLVCSPTSFCFIFLPDSARSLLLGHNSISKKENSTPRSCHFKRIAMLSWTLVKFEISIISQSQTILTGLILEDRVRSEELSYEGIIADVYTRTQLSKPKTRQGCWADHGKLLSSLTGCASLVSRLLRGWESETKTATSQLTQCLLVSPDWSQTSPGTSSLSVVSL